MPCSRLLLGLVLVSQETPILKTGETLAGAIDAKSPLVHTAKLDAEHANGAVRGVSVELRLEKSGLHTIELGSSAFDAYLVLRDAKLRMLRRYPERPELWAGFVLAGEWR